MMLAPIIELMNANKATLQSERGESILLAGNGTREIRPLQTGSTVSPDPDVSQYASIRQ